MSESKRDEVDPDGNISISFGRDLYWPDTLEEVKQFMPTYVYTDPEIVALEALKKQIAAE